MAATTSARASSSMDPLSLGAHVGAVVSASVEILEDFESVGHAHGMMLLCGSRLCRELNVMREAIAGEVEDVERTRVGRMLRKPLDAVLRVLSSPVITVTLALAALAAAFVEVLQDARPGGHHGAVFLAVNELLELLEASKVAPKRGILLKMIQNTSLRLFLAGTATILATIEAVGRYEKFGAHHGVLLLGVSKTLRCIGLLRDELYKEKEE